MSDLGPDLWNNAPDASSPVVDLRAFLNQLSGVVASWQVKANQGDWALRFDDVQHAIANALLALPEGDVFARKSAVPIYDDALRQYQATKDKLTLSDDWFLTQGEQDGSTTISVIDELLAYLRQLGIGLGAVAVGLVVLIVVLRFV